ncbi:MAG: sugar phosphate isomerase/epimerase [Puniceicoccales bacterium]|jgi:sugar phosphate isomerase/epimerase|nr:sugar phosphate isomerase/epimerase [Puniceicoccales bacterium]
MRIQTLQQLAVCSWSGWPDSPQTLVNRLNAIGLRRVQLAFDPLLSKPAWSDALPYLRDAGVTIVSGMFESGAEDYSTPARIRATGGVAPDAPYEAMLARVPSYLALLDQLGLDKISFHAGFIPHEPENPLRPLMQSRLATLAERFAAGGKLLLLETGQETAETLAALLGEMDAPNLRVNFDPGNMLLYSMGDPVAALRLLLPRIAQIHIKDAIPSGNPEVWGVEKPAGEGQVDWARFFEILSLADYAGDLVIERECGDDPVGEIKRAVAYLSRFLQA